MPNGGELKIEVHPVPSCPRDGVKLNFIKIIISDTGKGIPSHFIPRIFDPFFSTRPKGVGLGLSITYQIITKHGGAIKVESVWEKGTSFIINLPERLENS
jgi:signal transduction histidine kinase